MKFRSLGWSILIVASGAQACSAGSSSEEETLSGRVEKIVTDDTVHGTSEETTALVLEDGRRIVLDVVTNVDLDAGYRAKVRGRFVDSGAFRVDAVLD